jgi:hypothetical protein
LFAALRADRLHDRNSCAPIFIYPDQKKGHFWQINIHVAVLHSIFWVTQATYKLVTAGLYQFCR